VARSSSDGSAIRYVTLFLAETSCFHIMLGIKDDKYVSSCSPGGGTRGEVCRNTWVTPEGTIEMGRGADVNVDYILRTVR